MGEMFSVMKQNASALWFLLSVLPLFIREIQEHKIITSDFEIITSHTLRKFEGTPLNSGGKDVAPWGSTRNGCTSLFLKTVSVGGKSALRVVFVVVIWALFVFEISSVNANVSNAGTSFYVLQMKYLSEMLHLIAHRTMPLQQFSEAHK